MHADPREIDLVDPGEPRRQDQSSSPQRNRATTADGRSRTSKPPQQSMILSKKEELQQFDRYNDTRTSKDAPHCVTCACLSSKMTCSYYQQQMTCFDRSHQMEDSTYSCPGYLLHPPPSCRKSTVSENHDRQRTSARRRKRTGRPAITVDELVREMNLSSMLASAEDLDGVTEVENDTARIKEEEMMLASGCRSYRRRKHRCEAGDFYSQASTRSRPTPKPALGHSGALRYADFNVPIESEAWTRPVKKEKTSKLTEDQRSLPYDCGDRQLVAPTIDDLGSDNSAIDGPADELYGSRDNWHQDQLRNQGPKSADLLEAAKNLPLLEDVDKESSRVSEFDNPMSPKDEDEVHSESHVQQLKLVRMEFIERIYEEVGKLHRLQRHLDGCTPRRSGSQITRSVSTMTSARPSSSSRAEK